MAKYRDGVNIYFFFLKKQFFGFSEQPFGLNSLHDSFTVVLWLRGNSCRSFSLNSTITACNNTHTKDLLTSLKQNSWEIFQNWPWLLTSNTPAAYFGLFIGVWPRPGPYWCAPSAYLGLSRLCTVITASWMPTSLP